MEETMTTETSVNTGNVEANESTETWYSNLNEEYRNHPSIQKFTDCNGLAKSYLSLESMMGQEKIPVPKDETDANAWSLYHKAFNIPETAEKYQLKVEGIDDDAKLNGYKELMLRNHIPNKVAQELLDAHVKDFKDYENYKIQQYNLESEKTTQQLKADWGLKYEENIKTANNFLHKMCTDQEEYNYFNEKLGNDIKFIKLLTKMGDSISEGSLGGFEGQTGGFTKTPAEAKQELDKILNDPTDAYWAGARNKRNDAQFCKEHNLSFVTEDERKARVAYVNSLMQMQG